jgi:pimeloyl-ACP methyl ester carboxylesterase
VSIGKNFARALIAAVTALSMVSLTACSQPTQMPKALSATEQPAELQPFYEKSIDWHKCTDVAFCGDMTVPMNWADPTGETIRIAVAFQPAKSGNALGSVIFNPGGPGGSGVDFLTSYPDSVSTANLQDRFNIVGFDPRGVQNSEPKIQCLSSRQMDTFLYSDSESQPGTPEYVTEMRTVMSDFAKSCQKQTGPLLEFVDTVSVARDLDVLRALVGDAKLNYLGFSYGSLIGTIYANLFPKLVGLMVLDGAIDPTAPDAEATLLQLKGFDQSLAAFLSDCLTSKDCPFSGPLNKSQQKVAQFLYELESKPIETSNPKRMLTSTAALTGILSFLYSESEWPYLASAFAAAFEGDGTELLASADFYNDRAEDGTYASNTTESNIAVNCMDSRSDVDPESLEAANEEVMKTSPTLGRYWQSSGLSCADWPYPVAKQPDSWAAKGSAPILVIGTTGDPATPYSQSKALATNIFENAMLLTYVGEGHTAYGRSNECVANAVDDYFIKNVVFTENKRC